VWLDDPIAANGSEPLQGSLTGSGRLF